MATEVRATCPICRRPFEFITLEAQPAFPFCSERCRLIDLGRWIDGDYVIPGDARTPEDEAPTDAPREDDE